MSMNDLNWATEHERFMANAYPRTMKAAKRSFYGWHPRKKDDAIQECLAKMWDSYSRLLKRGKNPEPMISGLIKYAVLWVRYDRKLGGRARNPDVYDYRSGFTQQLLSDRGQPTPTDRASAANSWINWDQSTGDDVCLLAAALESTGITLNQWCDF
jgi:hypothetical protein